MARSKSTPYTGQGEGREGKKKDVVRHKTIVFLIFFFAEKIEITL